MARFQNPLSIPWYPRDFETDEEVMFMTNEAVGVYVRILNHIMIEGSAPASMEALAIIARDTPETMARVWPKIAVKFCPSKRDPQRIENKKINIIRKIQREKRRKESEGGRRGAEHKWKNKPNAVNNQDGVPHTTTVWGPVPSPDDLKEKEKEKEKENTTSGIDWFRSTYPPDRFDELLAVQMWISAIDTPEEEQAVRDGLTAALNSREWTEQEGRFVPLASNFISKRRYRIKYTPLASKTIPDTQLPADWRRDAN